MAANKRSHREAEEAPRAKTTLPDTAAAGPSTPTRKSPLRKATPSRLDTPARKTPASPSTAQPVPDSPAPRGRRPTVATKHKNTKAVANPSPVRRSARPPVPIDRYTDPWVSTRRPSPEKRGERCGSVYELSANVGTAEEQCYHLIPCERAGLLGAYVVLWGLGDGEGVRRKMMLSVLDEPEKEVKGPEVPKSPTKRKATKVEASPKKSKRARKLKIVEKAPEEYDSDSDEEEEVEVEVEEASPKKSKPARKLKIVEKAREEYDSDSDEEAEEEVVEVVEKSPERKKALPKKPRSPMKPKILAKGKEKVTEAESPEKPKDVPRERGKVTAGAGSLEKPKALPKGKGKAAVEAKSPEKPKAMRKPRFPKIPAQEGMALAQEVATPDVGEEDELSRQEQKEKRRRERQLRLAGVKPSWYSSDPDV